MLGHLLPGPHFLLVGNTSDVHWRPGEIALPIGRNVDDRIGTYSIMPRVSLRKVEAAESDEQDRNESENPLHNSRRIDSLNLL